MPEGSDLREMSSASTSAAPSVVGEEEDYASPISASMEEEDEDDSRGFDANQKKEEQPAASTRLPPELVSLIFGHLAAPADQFAFLLTNRLWFSCSVETLWFRPAITSKRVLALLSRTLSSDKELMTLPYYQFVRRLNFSTVASILNDETLGPFSICNGLERLTLTGCSRVSDVSLIPLIENNKRLQSIDLTNLALITGATINQLAESCKRLQGLYASNCHLIPSSSVRNLASKCPMMKRVKLNGCPSIDDAAVTELATNCKSIVEMNIGECQVFDESVATVMQELPNLREFRIAQNAHIRNDAFLNLDASLEFSRLRIVDLTSCSLLSDATIIKLVTSAPRLRNISLAKCTNVTDRGLQALSRLGRSLQYVHLGHCINITDRGIATLVRSCTRIQYIDVACCSQLTNHAVKEISYLPRLHRIGLVKCQSITDEAVYALAERALRYGGTNTIERIHLSYCSNITLPAVRALVNACPRLNHLSLTGITPFLRPDLVQYCRAPPAEFTQNQQAVFCVFSAGGVDKLRDHLNLIVPDELILPGQREFIGRLAPYLQEMHEGLARELDEEANLEEDEDGGEAAMRRREVMLARLLRNTTNTNRTHHFVHPQPPHPRQQDNDNLPMPNAFFLPPHAAAMDYDDNATPPPDGEMLRPAFDDDDDQRFFSGINDDDDTPMEDAN
ncbi:hypothetical protein TRVA0_028S01002 [Trichomonascus vanleenenianus]|uniref:SCF ubiquitin ligase complex subunit GRR1 n=1 Tax=Trichomonascus vanleenenianus TaxID=2268995 RepID=UPI003ECAA49A